MKLVLLNKPYRVLSQFTDPSGRATLADHVRLPKVYAAGRLDYDSEGLLLLTDDGGLKHRISHPRFRLPKTYWVQVEGLPDTTCRDRLLAGVSIKGRGVRALEALPMDEPAGLWARHPPIRWRESVPDSWICITLDEGRNRQVRRMCAAVGLPVLRLIRAAVGPWHLGALRPGESVSLPASDAQRLLTAFFEKRIAAGSIAASDYL